MRHASGHNYRNSSFIVDRYYGAEYHIPQNVFLVYNIFFCLRTFCNTSLLCVAWPLTTALDTTALGTPLIYRQWIWWTS